MRPLSVLLAAALSTVGCVRLLPSPVPMRSVHYPAPAEGERARCLLVLLPGAGDPAEAYQEQGFVERLRRRNLSVDLVAANATMGYYFKGVFVERLAEDVMRPKRAKGYEQTWVLGISMGGMGSLLYAKERPGQVDGVLALAPYLGDDDLIAEIRAAGGLAKWTAPAPAPLEEDNYQRQLWGWLQAVTSGQQQGPLLYVGYGRQDRMAGADEVLARALPPGRVFLTEGAHDWAPWTTLLEEFLDRSELSTRCARLPPSAR